MDLKEFADKQGDTGVGRKCVTCALDESLLSQVHDARRDDKPVSYPVIAKWLEIETGRKYLPNTIRNHFVAGHDNA